MNITDNTRALLWLNSFDMLSPLKRNRLIEIDEPYKIYNNLSQYKDKIICITDNSTYERLILARDKSYMNLLLDELNRYSIIPLSIYDDNYPMLLKEIDTPPILLYCRGNIEILNERLIAVVGTRLPTRYGKDVTENFVSELLKYGFHIVSGLARGVDTIAHNTAIRCKSPQIAVLGCGLDIIYPSENKFVYDKIIEDGGVIISEYRVGDKPLAYHFPERNRIISGLAEGVLVAEAGENSGSLITITCAVEQNRRVYIVPGNIYSKQSKGANERLKLLQGALITDVSDILEDYNIEKIDEEEISLQLNIEESIIFDALQKNDMHIEQLIKLTELSVNKLNSILTKMEIMGLIKKLHGNMYGV